MTQHPDLWAALAAPFDQNELKIRTQSGRQLHYITARTVMNRLDGVLGPENWWDRFVPGENSVLCELTVRLPDGSTLTKSDAGGYAGMADSGDDDKSGYSDAFKRAAVKFGVARYLYRDGVPSFIQERSPSPAIAPVETPAPEPARPAANGTNGHRPDHSTKPANGRPPADPRTGKAIWAWCKEMEQKHGVGLIKYLNSWARLQDFPGRMVDWDPGQVVLALAEARRKLARLESQEVAGD
jgi:hypothetical protein